MTATQTKKAIVSQAEWLQARRALLQQEKELTRQRDELSRRRRELPWVKVANNYVFDGPGGKVSLGDLFAGRTQLVIYHFMFGPEWTEGCPSCSMVADSLEGSAAHLANRDTTLVMVSRAPLGKIAAFQKRMGWTTPWVSSFGSGFNRDFAVSFTKEEMENGEASYNFGTMTRFPKDEAPGMSVFYKDSDGSVFHAYSTYGRGLEPLLLPYDVLDMTPKGRDEQDQISFPMAWVRHHDRYPETARSSGACCHSELS